MSSSLFHNAIAWAYSLPMQGEYLLRQIDSLAPNGRLTFQVCERALSSSC